MEKKVTNVLKQNKFYTDDEEIKIDACNKLDEFFLTYRFNGTKKNFLPSNITRNEKGYIILDEIPFISSNIDIKDNNENIHNNCRWIVLNNGSKILLKEIDEYDYKEKELLIMYFLKSINMNCANYDIATSNGKEYLISPSFLSNSEQIVNNFTNFRSIRTTYNECAQYGISIHYLKTLLSDIIYGNPNRENNFGRIYNNSSQKSRICPLFDNGKFALTSYESLSFPYLNNKSNETVDIVLDYLLNYEEILHWLRGPFKKTNLSEIVKRLEKEKEIKIKNTTYRDFEKYFKDSEYLINDTLKNKGKSIKIHLT